MLVVFSTINKKVVVSQYALVTEKLSVANSQLAGTKIRRKTPMISTTYIALKTQRLDLELRIIRHFLSDTGNEAARKAFIAAEAKNFEEGMKQYLERKPDRDSLDDL